MSNFVLESLGTDLRSHRVEAIQSMKTDTDKQESLSSDDDDLHNSSSDDDDDVGYNAHLFDQISMMDVLDWS